MTASVLLLNGPNLNMLGKRQPEIYGTLTLEAIEEQCRTLAGELQLELQWFQSNHEGDIIDRLHTAYEEGIQGIAINAGAYTHTSLAIADALRLFDAPIVELHLSNVFARESFRHHSYLSAIAKGVICGFGAESYTLALRALHTLIHTPKHG